MKYIKFIHDTITYCHLDSFIKMTINFEGIQFYMRDMSPEETAEPYWLRIGDENFSKFSLADFEKFLKKSAPEIFVIDLT